MFLIQKYDKHENGLKGVKNKNKTRKTIFANFLILKNIERQLIRYFYIKYRMRF